MAKRAVSRSRKGESAKRRVAKKVVKKKVTRKAAPRRTAARRPASAARPRLRAGVITHTELASADPVATKNWCATVLGWKFGPPMPTPTGPYHMWRFDIGTGGGIRANHPPEVPGSIPYCEVPDIHDAYDRALEAGAIEMLSPMALPEGMGWVAIVAAPGGVAIGFWAMK
jgi:predicted enzyme related to lactoylglutathione lyase